MTSPLFSELAAMTMFSAEALRAATEPSLSPAQQCRLSQLTHAGGSRSLTAAESAELEHLLDLYDRSVLRRAQALAILAHRRHEIPDRAELPASTDDDDQNLQTGGK